MILPSSPGRHAEHTEARAEPILVENGTTVQRGDPFGREVLSAERQSPLESLRVEPRMGGAGTDPPDGSDHESFSARARFLR
jgi:hypothetical protein